MGSLFSHAARHGWGLDFSWAEKEAVRDLTVIWSRGIWSAPSAYSSALNPLPHLVGGDGSILSGATLSASPIVSSPRFRAIPGGGSGLPSFCWMKRDYGRVAVLGDHVP
eukprot:scaffold24129_cov145-Isochrysis_galbana.AAC.1